MKVFSKILESLLLVTLLVGSNGCMTYNTIQYAKGHPENAMWLTFRNPQKSPPHFVTTTEAHPAYYALLPLTVPIDIATSPIQYITVLVATIYVEAHFGGLITFPSLAPIVPLVR